MSDPLDRLRRTSAPLVDDGARARALEAAMMAFDAQLAPQTQTKGSSNDARPVSAIQWIRNRLMSSFPTRMPAATAAMTLLLVPAGAFVAWNVSRDADVQTLRPAPETQMREVAPLSADRNFERAAAPVAKRTAPASLDERRPMPAPVRIDTERSEKSPIFSNGDWMDTAAAPVSTFSADVDTASYARVRREILEGRFPSRDMVRTEEFVNAFDYAYPAPDDAIDPFRATATLTDAPWNKATRLLHIGVKGYTVPEAERAPANLVFLIDTSGSMGAADKLPLLKRSFQLLLSKLGPNDRVSIVTYAGSSNVVLEPTAASERDVIVAALDGLRSGGGTAGADGIRTAYALARKSMVEGGTNRVMLATDGDFNVGLSDPDALERFIAAKRGDGIYLSVLGFGTGNLRDDTMQKLAQAGDGVAAYIADLTEARRVLLDQAGAALSPIADDLKLQVEFNPSAVSRYRLLGYETRALAREDFNDDAVDAGDLGSGHTVTAIYEFLPVGTAALGVDALRYSDAEQTVPTGEVAFVKLRSKRPGESESSLVTLPVEQGGRPFAEASADVRFSVAVAAFAQKLRDHRSVRDFGWDAIGKLARASQGTDENGRRGDFARLVELTGALKTR